MSHLCKHQPVVDWDTILSEDEDGFRTHPSVCPLCGLTGEHREDEQRWFRREREKVLTSPLTPPPTTK